MKQLARGKGSHAGLRWAVPLVAAAGLLGSSAAMPGRVRAAPPAGPPVSMLLDSAAQSMIAHHIAGPGTGTGWAWPSAIQAPQVNTDRDVGAASVGMGFIAAYQATGNTAYLNAAEQAADWLVSVAEPADGGLRWPNSVTAHGTDQTSYTSFDDGAMGIADFLYRVYQIDGDQTYLQDAEAGLTWEEAQAHGAGGQSCPAMCYWRWTRGAGIYTGMGMGVSGIADTFDLFAQRLGNPAYESYAVGAASYVESLINASYGAVPEQPGQPGWDSGYLSGSAGDAFMFLSLYSHTGDTRWLDDATELLGFVQRIGHIKGGQESWPIEFDPSGRQDNNAIALGTEEGNAGIGWVFLNAYEITGQAAYLTVAERAGNYLTAHLTPMDGGLACAEDIGQGHTTLFHTSLDSGAAGCGFFLHDLSVVSCDTGYADAASSLVTWLGAVAQADKKGAWWYQAYNSRTSRWIQPREMSWHWGQAGIVGFLSRLAGWPVSMPAEQQSIVPLAPSCPASRLS